MQPPTVISEDDSASVDEDSEEKHKFMELSSSLLMCDVCETRIHKECLDPPLQNVPTGGWICEDCVSCR